MNDPDDADKQVDAAGPTLCCVCTCDNPAAGIGPHSRQPMCPEHLAGDVEQVKLLQRTVTQQLQPFATADVQSIEQRKQALSRELQLLQSAFATARDSINEWESRVVQQLTEAISAAGTCLADCEDIRDYESEVARVEGRGDAKELFGHVMSMFITVDSLQEDFLRDERARQAIGAASQSSRVMELQRVIARLASEDAGSRDTSTEMADLQSNEGDDEPKMEIAMTPATTTSSFKAAPKRDTPVVQPKSDDLKSQLRAQYDKVKQLNVSPLSVGDVWALVSMRWVKHWREYVGTDFLHSKFADENYHPGPIDNDGILDSEGELKEHLLGEVDYTFMHKEAWGLLADYCKTCQPEPIFRHVIERGQLIRTLEIEVYLLDMKLVEFATPDKILSHKFSRAALFSDVEAKMRSLLSVSPKRETRMWASLSGTSYELLEDRSSTLENQVYNNQYVLLEVKGSDGRWPRGEETRSFTRSPADSIRGSGRYNYLQTGGGRFSAASFANAAAPQPQKQN